MTFLGLSNKSIQDSNLSFLTIQLKKKNQLDVNYEFGYHRRWKIKIYSKHLREICKAKIL